MFIDTKAIQHNLAHIQSLVGQVLVMPIIKANAYGIGFEAAAKAVGDGCMVGVADVYEAVEYRRFANTPILVLYQPDLDDIETLVQNDFCIAVSEIAFLRQLDKAAKKRVQVQLSIDTGLGTVGILPSQIESFCKECKTLKNIEVVGIFSQYAYPESFEPQDVAYSQKQSAHFATAVQTAQKHFGKLKYKSLCCSGAIVGQPQAFYDMVRPGYVLYGYYPQPFFANHLSLQPAIKLSAKVVSIRTMPVGTSLGYTGTSVLQKERTIATLAIGYSDGLSRKMSGVGCVVLHGQKAPILGSVCMDMTNVDVTDIPEVRLGDQAFVWDNKVVTLEQVSDWCEIGLDEFLTHLSKDIKRVMV